MLAVMDEVQSILPRVTIADGNLSEAHFNARGAVAELIEAVNDERDAQRMVSRGNAAHAALCAKVGASVDMDMRELRGHCFRRVGAALARVGGAA